MGTEKYVIVLTTFPLDHDAEAFAAALVEQRLAACVNVLPAMRSIYAWKGVVERSDERQLLIKTTALRVHELRTRLHELHPYDIPEFVVVPIIEGSQGYLDWIVESTSQAPSPKPQAPNP